MCYTLRMAFIAPQENTVQKRVQQRRSARLSSRTPKFQEPTIMSGSIALTPLQFIQSLPGGGAVKKVDFVDRLPGGDNDGYVTYRSPSHISIRKGVDTSDPEYLKLLIAHEVGHSIAYSLANRPDLQKPWGTSGYINNYAKKNSEEDFAETYAHWVLKRTIPKELKAKIDWLMQNIHQ